MRLTLRHKWRPRAFTSFLGFMDLKTGVKIALLFALLNKVAGVYGLIAVFTGGSAAQLSLYVYSSLALIAFAWGLRAVTNEDAKNTFYFAHIFLLDHLFSTIWTVFFGVLWWVYNPHDGQRIANSDAQKELMGSGHARPHLTDEERIRAAQMIWNKEKGFAAAVLIIGWLIKIYFALLIYSYALHLHKGSYRSLPLTNPLPESYIPLNSNMNSHPDDLEAQYAGEEEDDFYHRAPLTGASISSFAEFVSARGPKTPPPTRRSTKAYEAYAAEPVEEVLWDEEDEEGERLGMSATTASGASSKLDTEESDVDERNPKMRSRS